MANSKVVGLTSQAAKSYSFKLPSGGIHGATENSGRVFFARADGVCWVDADRTLSRNAESVTVNHLAIGEDAEGKPLRTGAFANHRNYVLFNSGRGPVARLCMVVATNPKPSVLQLNPGDGSIWVVSLTDFSVQAKLSVAGTPTRLISVGS